MNHALLEGIRVILDLSSFFEDKRKTCYYFVDLKRNRLISDVRDEIKSRFDIRNSIHFEINGCYVPENEDIRVLYNEDVIKVYDRNKIKDIRSPFIQNGEREGPKELKEDTSDTFKVKKLKRSKVNEDNDYSEMIIGSKRKKKCRKEEVNLEEENESYKSKKSIEKSTKKKTCVSKLENVELDTLEENEGSAVVSDVNINNPNLNRTLKGEIGKCSKNVNEKKITKAQIRDSDECTSDVHVQTHKLDPSMFITGICSTPKVLNPTLDVNDNSNDVTEAEFSLNDTEEMPNKLGDSFYKKRRRRKHKKKAKTNDLSSNNVFFTETLPVVPVVATKIQKLAKHIKFPDNEENVESNFKDSSPDVLCENNGIDSFVPSKQSVKSSTNSENSECFKNQNDKKPKYDSVVQSPIVLTNNNEIISNLISTTSKTPVIFECKKVDKLTNNQPEKSDSDVNFLKYPLLNNSPKVNDIIAFKKWKMDDNYCPGVSGFISAKVLLVSENEGNIVLKVLNGHNEFKEPQGKFSLEDQDENEEGEQPQQAEISDVEMKITDLLDVRIMFP